MTKIAFMFPGQGSFESGMGRDVAEAVPEAMAVYDEASLASGMDLKELCFNRPVEDLVDTEVQQPALVTTSLALDAALRARGIVPDYVSATRSASSRRSARRTRCRSATRSRSCASAGSRWPRRRGSIPGSMAAILGLADNVVEALCDKIHNVWPANYNCPGQIVISGETPAVDECCSEAELEGARRAIRLRVSGAFHSPLVERAGERLRPAIERAHFRVPKVEFMSTVTAKLEDAQRYRELLVEQLTAPVRFTQAATSLVSHGVTTFVEVGPGNVLSGLLKRIDRSVRTISVSDLKSLDEATEALG